MGPVTTRAGAGGWGAGLASSPDGLSLGSLPRAGLCSFSFYFFSWISFNCCHFMHSPWGPGTLSAPLNTSGAEHTNINSVSTLPHGERQPLIIEP